MAISLGIEKLVLLTVTTPDNCTDSKEFQRRWRKFHRFVKGVFPFGTWAREPQKRGAWHAHCAVAMEVDVRTGFDFESYRAAKEAGKHGDLEARALFTRKYAKSTHPALRKLWPVFRLEAKRCGYGRIELVPVEDSSRLGHYLSDYLVKGMGERSPKEKGVRLWGTWGKQRWASTRFAWNGPGGILRRRKLVALMDILGVKYEEFSDYFGRYWSHKINQLLEVLLLPLEAYPKMDQYMHDLQERWLTDKNTFASRQLVVKMACGMSDRYAQYRTRYSVRERFGLNERLFTEKDVAVV